MKVKLISHTKEPDMLATLAAKTTQSEKIPDLAGLTQNNADRIMALIRTSGHLSVMEHANFTFAIEGVSRALTHQLVRHRLASYSQQSQRYVKQDKFMFITPETIKNDESASQIYEIIMKNLADGYRRLVDLGMPLEDARYVLPNAAETKIIVTMNARELHHFFTLRCCERAQWEIRELARAMRREVKKVAPTLFKNAGEACLRGPCPEGKFYCGRKVKYGVSGRDMSVEGGEAIKIKEIEEIAKTKAKKTGTRTKTKSPRKKTRKKATGKKPTKKKAKKQKSKKKRKRKIRG